MSSLGFTVVRSQPPFWPGQSLGRMSVRSWKRVSCSSGRDYVFHIACQLSHANRHITALYRLIRFALSALPYKGLQSILDDLPHRDVTIWLLSHELPLDCNVQLEEAAHWLRTTNLSFSNLMLSKGLDGERVGAHLLRSDLCRCLSSFLILNVGVPHFPRDSAHAIPCLKWTECGCLSVLRCCYALW